MRTPATVPLVVRFAVAGLAIASVVVTSTSPAAAASSPSTVRTGATPLNVRTGPAQSYSVIRTLKSGTPITVACQVTGQPISGSVRTTARWDLLVNGGYVSDAYVAGNAPIPDCALTTAVSADRYIAAVAVLARLGYAEYQVPASVTIAQAMLESGLGQSDLARQYNNQFGIKCFGWEGPIATGCQDYRTWECTSAGCRPTTASFRAYRTLDDSVRDHGRFLRVNDRYADAFRFSRQPDAFIAAVHRAGYATDPDYAAKVQRLMRTYNLYRFDA